MPLVFSVATTEHSSAVNRAVGAEREPSSDDHRAFILPMSDRTVSFTIAGTPTSGAECVLKASSKEPEDRHRLGERLGRFDLALHPDKTRLIEFGRFARANRRKRGQGKPETFDFLGMTHFCEQTRKGRFRVGRKPSRKRVRRTLRRIKEALRMRRHDNRHETARWLGRVIHGWLTYHAVPGSGHDLQRFILQCTWPLMRALRRRSQRDRTDWEDTVLLTTAHWPKATIRHPWPNQRLVVRT